VYVLNGKGERKKRVVVGSKAEKKYCKVITLEGGPGWPEYYLNEADYNAHISRLQVCAQHMLWHCVMTLVSPM
jgi:hypothetical protein